MPADTQLRKPFSFSELMKKKETIGVIIALIAAYFVFPYFLEAHIYPLGVIAPDAFTYTHLSRPYPWLSLDPSWMIALNKFDIDKKIWGQDVTLTYGPLAYLSTRVGWGISKYNLLFYDLFVFFNFFFIFFRAYNNSENKKIALLLIIATCFLLPSFFASGSAIVTLAFLVFWARQSLDEPRPFHYLMQIAIIILIFFIKFNTSFIAAVLFFGVLGYKVLFTKENKVLLAGYFLTPIIFIVVLSKIMNVAVIDYLKGGLSIVSGYDGIMYLNIPSDPELKYSITFIFLTIAFLLVKTYLNRKTELFKNLVVVVLYSVSIYVLYKQSFVRRDPMHTMDFNKFSLLFVLCIPDFYKKEIFKFSYWATPVFIIFLLLFVRKREDQLFKLRERVFKTDYVKSLAHLSDSSGVHLFPTPNQIPDSILTKIGRGTVDVYPYNIQMVIENKLNYKPRPVFQAYAAFTPYLENLNYNFYNSADAPEYVLYDFENVDSRYSVFDESKVNMVIFNKYSFQTYFTFGGRPQLVLKKRPAVPNINLQKIREFEISLLEGFKPEENRYYEIFVSNTLKGTVSGLLTYAPEINLVITTKDGLQREFKTSRLLLQSGIFSNRYFNSGQDVYNLLLHIGGLPPENEVVSYSFKIANKKHFKNTIRIVEYKIN